MALFTNHAGVRGDNFNTYTVTSADVTANSATIQTDFTGFTFVIVQVRDSAGDIKSDEARVTFSGTAGTITVADQGGFSLVANDTISYIVA